MKEIEKTLLDNQMKEDSGTAGQSLEELLEMNDTLKVNDLAFLIAEAERGNQDAIYSVGISYLYEENGFPKDELEGVFWLSKSTNKEAPRHVAGYYYKQGDFENMKEWILKADEQGSICAYDFYSDLFKVYWKGEEQNLDYAEQCLEALLELKNDEERQTSIYRLAVGLAGEYLTAENYKKGLEWAKVVRGHLEPDLEEQFLGAAYSLILLDVEDCEEYIQEGLPYMKQLAERNGDADAQCWLVEAYLGKRKCGLGTDLEKAEYYLNLLEKNSEADAGTLQKAKELRGELDKILNPPQKILKSSDAEQLLKRIETYGGTILSIPSEYTEIAKSAFSYISHPYIMKIEAITIPESVRKIGNEAFEGCSSLKEIQLPKRLEFLGKYALKGSILKGFFMKTVKSDNVIENLTIPGQTKLPQDSLGDISGIGCLRFEEGRTELDWMVFYSLYQATRIGELHLPSSLRTVTNMDTRTSGLYIEKLYAPKHLQKDISRFKSGDEFTNIKEVIYF